MTAIRLGEADAFQTTKTPEQYALKVLAALADIPPHAIRNGTINAELFERLLDAQAVTDGLPVYVNDEKMKATTL